MGEPISAACAPRGGAVGPAGPAAIMQCTREPGERPGCWDHTLLVAKFSLLSCSVISFSFLCFFAMQCKFLQAAAPAMEDQLVVTVGEHVLLY